MGSFVCSARWWSVAGGEITARHSIFAGNEQHTRELTRSQKAIVDGFFCLWEMRKAIGDGFFCLLEMKKALRHGFFGLLEMTKAMRHGFFGLSEVMKAMSYGFFDLQKTQKAIRHGFFGLTDTAKAIGDGFFGADESFFDVWWMPDGTEGTIEETAILVGECLYLTAIGQSSNPSIPPPPPSTPFTARQPARSTL